MRRFLIVVAFLPLLLSACGDTWRGAKEDTRDNTAATGRAIENAGDKVQKQAE